MRSVWDGKNKKLFLFCCIGIVLAFPTGCDDPPARTGDGFYSYRGFRDWWRIPLRFPYQITVVDSFDQGVLEKYDPTSPIDDPRCETLVDDITEIGHNGKFAVFRQKDVAKTFGILIYASGSVKKFGTREELVAFIERNDPTTSPPKMMKLETFYESMWRTLDQRSRGSSLTSEPCPIPTGTSRKSVWKNTTRFAERTKTFLRGLVRTKLP